MKKSPDLEAQGGRETKPSKDNVSQTPPRVNAEFLAGVHHGLSADAAVLLASFQGNPKTVSKAAWFGKPWRAGDPVSYPQAANSYFCVSYHKPNEKGEFRRRKAQFAGMSALMLDDVGTKIPLDRMTLAPSWMIETSPGNYQAGYILAKPMTDFAAADALVKALIDAELCDPGADGPTARYARLPFAVNGKHDPAFPCRLTSWTGQRFTPEQIVQHYGLVLRPAGQRPSRATACAFDGGNPVIASLKAKGLYKSQGASGWHEITCPWVSEHTGAVDGGTGYHAPEPGYPLGAFKCFHAHDYTIIDLLEFLGVDLISARCKPVIRIQAGELDRVVDEAERCLAESGLYFQSGGAVVQCQPDPSTGDASVQTLPQSVIPVALSRVATWTRFDARSKCDAATDPPDKISAALFGAPTYARLPVIRTVNRQPHLTAKGELIASPGYDSQTQSYGAFDPSEYNIPEAPTRADAEQALALLLDLFGEFAFDDPELDRAACLASALCAAVRPSLPTAPAVMILAHTPGSGKSCLAKVLGAFAQAGPTPSIEMPREESEVKKTLISYLMQAPGALLFDNLTRDLGASPMLCSGLSDEFISGRLLGISRTVNPSTRTMVLCTGNNVRPLEDVVRRVLPVHLDPRIEDPKTRVFAREDIVGHVRSNRAKYVSACLTIVRAWILAGSPRAKVLPVGYAEWTSWCRMPLLWLGLPDPATRLLVPQSESDPVTAALKNVIGNLVRVFGLARSIKSRDLLRYELDEDLREALLEVAADRGSLCPRRLGSFFKKHEGKVIAGQRLSRCGTAQHATLWRVEGVVAPF